MAKLQKPDDIEEDALAAKRTFDARWTESHLQKRGELKQLFDFMVRARVLRYLEIGSRNGHSTYILGGAVEHHVTCIDWPGVSWGQPNSSVKLSHAASRLEKEGKTTELLFGDSHSKGLRTEAARHGPYDFMFLDGDHTARGVRQDYLDYRSLVTPNGFIAFHDITADPKKSGNIDKNGPIEVAKVWHEIKCHPRSGNTWEFVDVGSDYGIGVVDNAECYLLGVND